jgi:hypothetical protein
VACAGATELLDAMANLCKDVFVLRRRWAEYGVEAAGFPQQHEL